jgi:hypothetical protein
LIDRIKKRARDYELEFYTQEYLKQINKGLRVVKRKLLKLGSQSNILKERNIGDFENHKTKKEKMVSDIIRILKH